MMLGFPGAGRAPLSLSALLLCLAARGALSQDPPPLTKTGPKECANDSTVLGYDNTTTLTIDMLLDHDEIVEALLTEGNPAPSYEDFIAWQKKQPDTSRWLYVLCPKTSFDLGDVYPAEKQGEKSDVQTVMPIVPFVPNSVIQCGKDGSVTDNCVVTGGLFQLVFEDDHLVTNVTFAGITFQDNRLISVAAYGHQLNDGAFVNCRWLQNSGTPILVDLAYDPDMVFGIIERNDGGGRRRRKAAAETSLSSRRVSKIGSINTKLSVDWATSSKINERAARAAGKGVRRLQDDDVHPGMLAGFYGCSFLGNSFGFGILNEGGRVDLDDTTFEQNVGIACVVVIKGGQLALHGGTTLSDNKDMFGPVFLDSESELVMNENVVGQGNVAMDRNGVPIDDSCDAIFKEVAEGSNCLGGDLCVGECCSFGMPGCFEGTETATGTTTAPRKSGGGVQQPGGVSAPKSADGGGRGGCDSTCIVISTVVPVCTIALILFGVWAVRRGGNKGGGANNPSENVEPTVASAPPPTSDEIHNEFVEPKADEEHHMA